MSVGAEELRAIDAALATSAADGSAVAALRRLAPGLTVTRCDAADLREETPFRAYTRCALYLLDGREHCAKITSDPARATGLVLVSNGSGE